MALHAGLRRRTVTIMITTLLSTQLLYRPGLAVLPAEAPEVQPFAGYFLFQHSSGGRAMPVSLLPNVHEELRAEGSLGRSPTKEDSERP